MRDVFAVATYLSISVVFFIVGLVPDVAAVRDASTGWRRRIYGLLGLGWEGSDGQWRHYRRGYGLLAALATPLVLSVHSVVSWDFAMALLPGWHSTLFAPFFVDGAIFSGFAMVIILVVPMRYFFHLHAYIGQRHLDALAKLLLATGLVLTYFYACDAFTAWYSGIVVFDHDQVDDKVAGLDAGADDVIAKPVAMEELLARARALLRRPAPVRESPLRLADLMLDPVTREVRRAEQRISLTPREFALLEYLLRNTGRVLTRCMIRARVWGLGFDPESNLVDVYVGYLRRKIERDGRARLLHSVRGVGYVLAVEPP